MSEMIERVARAIRAESTGHPEDGRPIKGDGADHVGVYTELARAAIEAMREPTDAMCDDGDIWADGPGYSAKVWNAMIDVALK